MGEERPSHTVKKCIQFLKACPAVWSLKCIIFFPLSCFYYEEEHLPHPCYDPGVARYNLVYQYDSHRPVVRDAFRQFQIHVNKVFFPIIIVFLYFYAYRCFPINFCILSLHYSTNNSHYSSFQLRAVFDLLLTKKCLRQHFHVNYLGHRLYRVS